MAVRDFFEHCGFEHVNTFHRSIPNKRMPLRNSPTNAIGAVDHTMTKEYIVVMQRTQAKRIQERRAANKYRVSSKARATKKR